MGLASFWLRSFDPHLSSMICPVMMTNNSDEFQTQSLSSDFVLLCFEFICHSFFGNTATYSLLIPGICLFGFSWVWWSWPREAYTWFHRRFCPSAPGKFLMTNHNENHYIKLITIMVTQGGTYVSEVFIGEIWHSSILGCLLAWYSKW